MVATTVAAPVRDRRPLAALLLANLISLAGSMLTLVAIPWFVLATTGSAAKAGLTGFSEALPYFVGGLLGGAIVDRLGARRVSIVADLAGGALVALIPLLHGTIGLNFWGLQLLVFLGGLLRIPGSTARAALVPELATRAGVALERVNAATQATDRGARLLGAPLAGVLIAAIGPAAVLWLDAATFAISALSSPPWSRSRWGRPARRSGRSRRALASARSCAPGGATCAATGCCWPWRSPSR